MHHARPSFKRSCWFLCPVSLQAYAAGGVYGEGASFVNPTYQYFLVSSNKLTVTQPLAQLQNTVPINLYPWLAIMPGTGVICVICGAQTRFYTCAALAFTSLWVQEALFALLGAID